MAKTKKDTTIYVKTPKIGQTYMFSFAGSVHAGSLYSKNEKLTKQYNEPWYTMLDNKGTKYPVSIFTLRHIK